MGHKGDKFYFMMFPKRDKRLKPNHVNFKAVLSQNSDVLSPEKEHPDCLR